MNVIKQYKFEILISIAIVVLYFISRLIILSSLPIFTDEAIYVRWTQIAANDASWRFISLTDGKQPMFIWVAMLFVKLFKDPLVAVRLVSVISGFFTLIGLVFLTYELFRNRMVALLSAFLYVIFPFAVVYDRMALYDSMVGSFAVWAIYFSILLVRRIRLDIAYTLGFVLAGGMLTKSNANFSILMLPFTLILFNFKNFKKGNLVRWIFLALFGVDIAEVFYNTLRLSPFFHIIAEKNTIFVYPISEWIKHPFMSFFGNLGGLSGWIFMYLTPFLFAAIVISFFSRKFLKEKILLVLYFLAPFLADALFGKVIFPRHVFFTSLYLLPLAALGIAFVVKFLDKFFQKRKLNIGYVITGLVIAFFVIYPIKISLDFIFNPIKASIPESDKNQYINDWPSGGGIKESVSYFQEQALNNKIYVATQGTFGLLPYGLEAYLEKNKNITIKGYWPIGSEIPEDVLDKSNEMPTYFVFYEPCDGCSFAGEAPKNWPLTLIKRYKKGDGKSSLVIYQVK